MGIYTEIFKKNHIEIQQASKKSQTWFQQQAGLLTKNNVTATRLIRSEPARNVNRVVPGEMYLFSYSPKHQDTLPYWDMFPLVFPFKKMKDGFIGLNLHYLPYPMRIQLLERLMDFKTNSLMNENTRLKYSWNMIQGVSRFKIAEPCVHRYLADHLQSPMKKIDASDWATALLLPVEKFVGASKRTVWSDSLK